MKSFSLTKYLYKRNFKTNLGAYGQKIASNTNDVSKNAGFISSMVDCDSGYINDPAYGLRCCFEDTNNVGQCLCDSANGTIDDFTNPGSCCFANVEHPDNCLCSGTDIDDPNNPGTCCFEDSANPGQCLCITANYIDDPDKSKITTNNLWIHLENQKKNFNYFFQTSNLCICQLL